MNWIINNWSFLVVAICLCVVFAVYVKKFANTPTEQQISQVKAWLLYAVIQAEKELGGGTGVLKLRYVYDLFIQTFPALVNVISFELFSKMVDEVLEQMRHLLDTNSDIKSYVEGGSE